MFQTRSDVLEVLLRRAVEESRSSVVITDPNGCVRYVNKGFEETTGYAREEVLGQNIRLLKSGRQRSDTYRDLWNTVLEGRTWRGVLHNRRKDGSHFWARATIDPVANESGRILYFIAIQEDVTGDVETRDALVTRANHLDVLRDLGHVALEQKDLDGVFRFAIGAIRRVLDGSPVEISVSFPRGRSKRFEAGPEEGGGNLVPGRVGQENTTVIRVPIPGRPGPYGEISVTLPRRTPTDEDLWFLDNLAHILAAAILRKNDEDRIRHLAHRDPLTGLPNRRVLHEKAYALMAQARRGGFKVAVLFLDLDRFKEVNDTLGHAAGDELLARLGRRLHRSLRRGETLARLGGDEFAILLAPVRGDEPEKAAQRILKRLEVPFRILGRRVRISASIGFALFPDDGETLDALLGYADHGMYRVKTGGGGGVGRLDSTSGR